MTGGILTSIKDDGNNEISEVISDFEQESVYDTSGYVSDYPYNEDNVNIIGKTNGKVAEGISNAINKVIDSFFELVKKLVS
jgi:hypothetical protein